MKVNLLEPIMNEVESRVKKSNPSILSQNTVIGTPSDLQYCIYKNGSIFALNKEHLFIDALQKNCDASSILVRRLVTLSACDRNLVYDSFGTYFDLVAALDAQNFPSVLLDEHGSEPNFDSEEISDLLSSGRFKLTAAIPIFIFNDRNELTMTKYFVSDSRVGENSKDFILRFIMKHLFAEFHPFSNYISPFKVKWMKYDERDVVKVEMPPSRLVVEIYMEVKDHYISSPVLSLEFDAFANMDDLFKTIQTSLHPWKLQKLQYKNIDLLNYKCASTVTKRSLNENIFSKNRGIISTHYRQKCIWEVLCNEGNHFKAFATFEVPISTGNNLLWARSNFSLDKIELAYRIAKRNSSLLLTPKTNAKYQFFEPKIEYSFQNIYVLRPYELDVSASFALKLPNEIPYFQEIQKFLLSVGNNEWIYQTIRVYPLPSTGFSLFNLSQEALKNICEKIVSAKSVTLLKSGLPNENIPFLLKSLEKSAFVQNAIFYENALGIEPVNGHVYVTWGFIDVKKCSDPDEAFKKDILFNSFIGCIQNFAIFELSEDKNSHYGKVLVGIFVARPNSSEASISYYHEVQNWDSTAKYDVNYSNMDWAIFCAIKLMPAMMKKRISKRSVYSVLSCVFDGFFDFLEIGIGKLEYFLFHKFVIAAYFQKFSEFKNINVTTQRSDSILVKIITSLPFCRLPMRWSSTVSSMIAKYVELPIFKSIVNELLNSFDVLKKIPLFIFKRLMHALAVRLWPQKSGRLLIFDPESFDNRLIRVSSSSKFMIDFDFVKKLKTLNVYPIFKDLWVFGPLKYSVLKASSSAFTKFYDYLFVANVNATIDYTEDLKMIYLVKILTALNLEPKKMTFVEKSLLNSLQKVYASGPVSTNPFLKYANRQLAIFSSKFLSKRMSMIFKSKTASLYKEINEIDAEVSAIKDAVSFIKEVNETVEVKKNEK